MNLLHIVYIGLYICSIYMEEKKQYISKWGTAIADAERCKLMKGCIHAIQDAAREKGFTATYYEMSRLLRGKGIQVSDAYMYKHVNGTFNRYPFPFEVLVMLCKVYDVPFDCVFSSHVMEDANIKK